VFEDHSRGGVSKTALRLSLLDLGSSRVRVKSERPGDLRRMACDPAESLRVAGALPWNLPSMKISAASGSEVMVSWPKPSGGADGKGGDAGELEVSAS